MSQSVPYYRFPEPADGRGRTPQPEGAVFHDVMLYCDYVLASDYERQAAEIESLKRDCEEKDDLSDQLLATSVRLRAALEQIASMTSEAFGTVHVQTVLIQMIERSAELARKALAPEQKSKP